MKVLKVFLTFLIVAFLFVVLNLVLSIQEVIATAPLAALNDDDLPASSAANSAVPITGAYIVGPSSGVVGVSYAFTAVVTPTNASPPIRYEWSPEPDEGQRRIVAKYTWLTPGTKVITLVVTNKNDGRAVATRTVDIIPVPTPIDHVDIAGPASGTIYQTDRFTATVSPVEATIPVITYLWSPEPENGQNTPFATYSWEALGDTSITVTVTNAVNSKAGIHHLDISSIPITQVNIIGFDTGTLNQLLRFKAEVVPVNATRPITFTWFPDPDGGQSNTPEVTYTLKALGAMHIVVLAENMSGYQKGYYTVTVVPEPIRIADVAVKHPSHIIPRVPYMFTAVVSPEYATQPLTYTWFPSPAHQLGRGESAVYVFTASIPSTVTVNVKNVNSEVTKTQPFFVESTVHLPTIMRRWPLIPDQPKLFSIDNDDGDNNYTVSWETVDFATTYVLAEGHDPLFLEDGELYNGSAVKYVVSGSSPTRYYYRVKARNNWGDSRWSDVKSVDVVRENEPNTYVSQANGPLLSGIDYFGFPDQAPGDAAESDDWYYIDVERWGTISVDLIDDRDDGVQLLLYRETITEVVGWDYNCTTRCHVKFNGSPGQYYIYVYSLGEVSTSPYTLTVKFP